MVTSGTLTDNDFTQLRRETGGKVRWNRQLNRDSNEYQYLYRDELERLVQFYERRIALFDEECGAPPPPMTIADLKQCHPTIRAAAVAGGLARPLTDADRARWRDSNLAFVTMQLEKYRRELASRKRAAQRGALDAHPDGRVPQEVIDQIKQRISLVGAVEHESDTRLGRETARGERRGSCPLCGVSSQPFLVHTADPHDEWFWCHACGQHGDVIDFTMFVYNQPFRTAVVLLAQRCGIDWPPRQEARGRAAKRSYVDIALGHHA